MAFGWRRVLVALIALPILTCAQWLDCRAQTTAPSVDTRSQEDKSVDQSATTDQNKQPQADTSGSSTAPDYSTNFGVNLFKRLGKDQIDLWTFPRHLSWEDADIIVPFGMATGGMLATDSDFSRELSNSPSRIDNSKKFSNYGIGAMVGVGGGMYLWGQFTHDQHKKETGFLSGEAAVNGVIIAEALKYTFGRTRPLEQPLYSGDFWHGGVSMPSEHAVAAWAIASVVAHEYPGPLTSFLVYGLASSISLSRITAKQHFPSDVLVGSVIGWYVGKQAYRTHHDPELGGGEWQIYV